MNALLTGAAVCAPLKKPCYVIWRFFIPAFIMLHTTM